MRNAVSRVVAFSSVALLHVAVLMISWQHRAPGREHQRYLTWVNIEPEQDARSPEPEHDAPTRAQGSSTRPSPAPAVEAASSAISAPPVDWRTSMETSASAAAAEIIRRDAYRPLGPVQRGASGSSPSESIFEQPLRKAGDIDHDSTQGRTLIWHNERCYTELKFPTLKDPNAIVGAPNPPKCMYPIGKRSPRGNLFEGVEER